MESWRRRRRHERRMRRHRPLAPRTQTTGARAQQVSATLTVEVRDSNAVSRAAQDALDLTRSLGGYVVSSSVATGEQGNASLTVRVPVARGPGRDHRPLRTRTHRLAAGHGRRPAGDSSTSSSTGEPHSSSRSRGSRRGSSRRSSTPRRRRPSRPDGVSSATSSASSVRRSPGRTRRRACPRSSSRS